ncbi:D-serine permease DsdX [Klebsiella pneumoniae IS10]|nr:D-serine permease DsdX [Klebsiella pneumoniae IS10]
MVLVGLICGITLFVEVGVVLLIPLAFSIAKKTNTSLLKLAIPLCSALMVVHCVVPPHPAALFVANKLGADIGTVIVYGLLVGLIASLVGGRCSSGCSATACRLNQCQPSFPTSTFAKNRRCRRSALRCLPCCYRLA